MHNYYYDRTDYSEAPGSSGPAAVRRRRRKPRPVLWFTVFLTLICLGITLVVYLSLGRLSLRPGTGRPALPAVPDLPPFSGRELERAPTGDGTVLVLYDQPLTPPLPYPEIYQNNAPSIVFIRATGSGGVMQGTGIVMTENGYILTNAHVIANCFQVDLVLEDGTEYQALLVGLDTESDLAVLKVDAADLQPAQFGDSDTLQVGDTALALGNSLGETLRGTMTDGIISAINRDITLQHGTMALIQTSAALNSGNSGGALLNAWGQVIGITTLKMTSWYESVEGLGFAIPATTAKRTVDDLIALGYVSGRPAIGITVRAVTADTAAEYGAGTPPGLRLEKVDDRSDAWRQGLRFGDILVEAEGVPVLTIEALNALKDLYSVGDILRLKVWRTGEYLEFDVTLIERYELE